MTRTRNDARLVLTVLAVVTLAGCNLRDALSGTVTVVARADDHHLTVERLAETVAAGRAIPTDRPVLTRWTHRWVEYSLFAQRVARGDSLLDSATVIDVMWPGVYRALVGELHDRLLDERLDLARAVDSAYVAGELRVIRHILIRTQPEMTPAQRLAAQRSAEAIWGRLVNGGPWVRENERNEDPGARQRGGSLGVIRRGQTVPEFESVAFALRPGEISQVTQTQFGFHVIQRPFLESVRDDFAQAVERTLIQQVDSTYLAQLETDWRIRVKGGAPPAMREAALVPDLAAGSSKTLGTYRGGSFTVADFVRWLQTRPPRDQQLVQVADDEQLDDFLRSLIRNEVLLREARAGGIRLHDSTYAALKTQLAEVVGQLRQTLGLDSVLAGVTDPAQRLAAATDAADRYMARLATNLQDAKVVEPSLAARLKDDGRWSVSFAGLEQARERARSLRATQGAAPAVPGGPGGP